MFNKTIFLLLFSLIPCLNATILKNGFNADQKRIDQVWKGMKKTKHYPLLLCTALDCKEGKITDQVARWELGKKVVAEWTALNIIRNDVLDKETQEIIITSYFENREPIWGVEASKKIALATPVYPVDSWVENIPGYSLVQRIKRLRMLAKQGVI